MNQRASGIWRKRVSAFLFGDEMGLTRVVAWSTAVFGIFSGYCLYILWWEQEEKGESGWLFALGFAAAALMSFAFELLRGAIEGHEHPWSRSRIVSTVVMLAAFELFIIATHGAIEMPTGTFANVAGLIFGEQFAEQLSPGWNLAALALLWVVVALTIVSKLRIFVLSCGPHNSNALLQTSLWDYLLGMRPDIIRGAWAGFRAGAIWGPVSALGYVFILRAYLLARWIHSDYPGWQRWLESHQTHNLPGLVLFFLYGPPFLAGMCAKYFGALGMLIAVIAVSVAAIGVTSKENREMAAIWPALSIVVLLGSPILADPVARHDLFWLAILSAVIWGTPATLLGGLAPLLRQPSRNPSVWGLVASAAGGVMIVVTLTRFIARPFTAIEPWLLSIATLLLFFLAFYLFQGMWAEEFWLLLALSIGTIIWGTTSLIQKINLFDMQRNAHTLIDVSLAPVNSDNSTDELKALISSFGHQFATGADGGTFATIWPMGVNVARFLSDPCGEARAWTPEQRDQFATNLQHSAVLGHTSAQADETRFQEASLQFEELKRQLGVALDRAAEPLSGAPGEQVADARQQELNLTTLDAELQGLPDLARKKTHSIFLGYGQPRSVCQPDLDRSLADLDRVAQEREAATAKLGKLYQNVVQELPVCREKLCRAREHLALLREDMQLAQAHRLELTMTSSLGFWVTVGLLAIWRLSK